MRFHFGAKFNNFIWVSGQFLTTVYMIQPKMTLSVCVISRPAITCSKLTIETLEQGVKYEQPHWRRSGVFIVTFEHISHLSLVFLLLTLTK